MKMIGVRLFSDQINKAANILARTIDSRCRSFRDIDALHRIEINGCPNAFTRKSDTHSIKESVRYLATNVSTRWISIEVRSVSVGRNPSQIARSSDDVQIANLKESAAPTEASPEETREPRTLARKLEEAWILNVILMVAGIAALGLVWRRTVWCCIIDLRLSVNCVYLAVA
jgi:hypothetical protein